MGKRLFLLFIGGVIGVLMSPRTLTAADQIVMRQPVFHDVETVDEVAHDALRTQLAPQPTPIKLQSVTQVKSPLNYTVTVYASTMVAHGLSYSDIYKTGKLLYAHNSSNLFGSLSSLAGGEIFYVTESSGTKAYQVMTKVVYDKTADGYLNNNAELMGDIVYTALGYDVALMTCAGTSYGNGDASQRLVVFAKAI